MRLLTNIGPPEWHPANQKIKELCAQAANYCKVSLINPLIFNSKIKAYQSNYNFNLLKLCL